MAECLWFNVGTTMLILKGEMTHFTVVMDYHFNIICSLNSVYVSFGRWNFDVHHVWFRGELYYTLLLTFSYNLKYT